MFTPALSVASYLPPSQKSDHKGGSGRRKDVKVLWIEKDHV